MKNYISPQDWHKKGQYFTYKDYQIFYVDEGQGEVLICPHGFPTASWDWSFIWEELTSHFRVIVLDMIGFGFSDKPRNYTYSIHDQASIHEKLLEKLNVNETHILAHDYGDTVAQEILARFEDRRKNQDKGLLLKSIAFLNGGIFPEMHRPRLIQKLLNSPIGFLISSLAGESRFRKSFSEVFGKNTKPTDQELKDFWYLISNKKGNKLMHKLIKYIDDRKQHRDRWVNAIIETPIPKIFINGPEDPVSGRHATERYKELVPNPKVVLLEGIGHYPQTEAPEKVLKAYFEFMGIK